MAKVVKVGLVVAGITGLGIAVLAACGFEPPNKNTQAGLGGGSGPGGPCVAKPGEFPEPNCDNSDNDCTEPGCPIEPQCGTTSSCLPMADNAGKDLADLRLRSLIVTAPAPLATSLVQRAIITKNIDLKAKQCGETGNGAFNWLIRVDRKNNSILTGGAPPSDDPFGVGFCFYNHTTPSGIEVVPEEIKVTFTGDTFTTDPIPKLNVPIFLNGDVNNTIILPLTNVVINKVTLSNSDNCVGRFEPKSLTSDCTNDPESCAKWTTAGAIGGYITLEEADNVEIADLSQSLCVLLTGADKNAENKCPREAGKLAIPDSKLGDFCSTSQKAGECRDSFWLAATFAASAATITDGAGVAECKPGGSAVIKDSGAPDAADATPE
jgi:hypothetical protein